MFSQVSLAIIVVRCVFEAPLLSSDSLCLTGLGIYSLSIVKPKKTQLLLCMFAGLEITAPGISDFHLV